MSLGLTVEFGHRFTDEVNRPKSFVYARQNQGLTVFIPAQSFHFDLPPTVERRSGHEAAGQ